MKQHIGFLLLILLHLLLPQVEHLDHDRHGGEEAQRDVVERKPAAADQPENTAGK